MIKSKEEIEQLAFKSYGETLLKGSFIHGYTQCQEDNMDKKYTEENIKQAIIYGMNTKQIDWGMVDEFIKSLNKQE